MPEWIKGSPQINSQFWTQLSRVEGNGKITTTFYSIRGKRGDEKLQIKQFVEQINRYTETTIGFDLRDLTKAIDAYRRLSENLIRLFEGMSNVNLAEMEKIAMLGVGVPMEETGESDHHLNGDSPDGDDLPVRPLL